MITQRVFFSQNNIAQHSDTLYRTKLLRSATLKKKLLNSIKKGAGGGGLKRVEVGKKGGGEGAGGEGGEEGKFFLGELNAILARKKFLVEESELYN